MYRVLFLNKGNLDARIKLTSDGTHLIGTTSEGPIVDDGTSLGFCIKPFVDPTMTDLAIDTSVVWLKGLISFSLEVTPTSGNLTIMDPEYSVDAKDVESLFAEIYPDLVQVERAGDIRSDGAYPYRFKTNNKTAYMFIYKLDKDGIFESEQADAGVYAGWTSPTVKNCALFSLKQGFLPESDTVLLFDTALYKAGNNEMVAISEGDITLIWPNGEQRTIPGDTGAYPIAIPQSLLGNGGPATVELRMNHLSPAVFRIKTLGLTEVVQWSASGYELITFNNCTNLVEVPDVTPIITNNKLDNLFLNCTNFNNPRVTDWDVTKITSFVGMFSGCTSFNQPLNWDVRIATDMTEFLNGAEAFNQDLSNWCVPGITEKPANFAPEETMPLAKLPVWGTCPANGIKLLSFVKNSKNLRIGAYFDDGIEQTTYIVNSQGSVVSDITGLTTTDIPAGTYSLYCQPSEIPNDKTIADLNVTAHNSGLESVTAWSKPTIKGCYISSFNYPSTSLIGVPPTRPNSTHTDFEDLFVGATLLNDPNIALWDVSGVTRFNNAFKDCRAFAQDLTAWDVSSGTHFFRMFESTQNFQSPIGNWNMSNATSLESMFQYSKFNQDIGNWNVSEVNNLTNFINEATNFSQDLSKWCVTNITTEPNGWTWRNPMTPELSPVWGTCPTR